jgi:putative MATE family efflux protein
MPKELTLEDRNIKRVLFKLSGPATVGMLVMSLYNVVDTIFIGRGVGTAGIGGVAIAFPIMMIVGAIGQMIGIGGASLLSRRLGAKDLSTANKILGNVIASVAVLSLPIICFGFLSMDSMLKLFGATDTLLPYAREYMQFILPGIFMHSLAMALNNLVRAEGNAKVAMLTMILSAVTNIILDAVFIFGLNMGIRGAALATLIAYIAGGFFLIFYYLSGRSILTMHVREIRFDYTIQKEIVAIGVSVFVRHTAMSLLVILLNNTLGRYGGDIAIAVYGVVMRLMMMIFTPIMGIAQGLQPVAGYNYGAKDYMRVKESVVLATFASTVIATAGTLIIMLFPQSLLRIFSDDVELLRIGGGALRYIVLAFPILGFQLMGTTLFQALGKAAQTFILTLSRQILFLIPLVVILPRFFQLTGVWISFPIADVLSTALTVWMLIPLRNQLNRKMKLSMEECHEE